MLLFWQWHIVFLTGSCGWHLVPVHEIVKSLGPRVSQSLPMFHALTGCDTVSSFHTIGKKKAWQVWAVFPDITSSLIHLSAAPVTITEEHFHAIQRFVILTYDRGSSDTDVNSARMHLFTKRSRQIESIPPTEAALYQHVKRAVYQGGHIWGQASQPAPKLPNPSDWGWMFHNGQWLPHWSNLPQASVACRELIKCGCRKGCKKRCKCVREGLDCTALCACDGQCARD